MGLYIFIEIVIPRQVQHGNYLGNYFFFPLSVVHFMPPPIIGQLAGIPPLQEELPPSEQFIIPSEQLLLLQQFILLLQQVLPMQFIFPSPQCIIMLQPIGPPMLRSIVISRCILPPCPRWHILNRPCTPSHINTQNPITIINHERYL